MEKEALKLIEANQVTTAFNISLFQFPNHEHAHGHNRHQHQQGATRDKDDQDQDRDHYQGDIISFTRAAICSSESTTTSTTNFRVQEVQESTSTLLAARALIKANRTDDAWSYLRSLFSMQGTNGFMPRYIYWDNHPNTSISSSTSSTRVNNIRATEEYYYNGTTIPTAKLFPSAHDLPIHYIPCPPPQDDKQDHTTASTPSLSCLDINGAYTYVQELNITSSGRLSATPMHATSLLELFYLSNQTRHDLNQLRWYFDRIYKMHNFWMERVMKHCKNDKDDALVPCYNIIHPFESLVPIDAPQWERALAHIMVLLQEQKWTPNPRAIPPKHYSMHFPKNESVYHAMLYLLECHANVTSNTDTIGREAVATDFEAELLRQCPFAMLDLSHLAILSKAHRDLYQIGTILHDSHSKNGPTRTQWDMIQNWMDVTDGLMDEELWYANDGENVSERSEADGTSGASTQHGRRTRDTDSGMSSAKYYSKNLVFVKNDTDTVWHGVHTNTSTISTGTSTSTVNAYRLNQLQFDYNGTEWVESYNAVDLLAGWDRMPHPDRFATSILMPMLDRNTEHSFNCEGMYAIPSWACDSHSPHNTVTSNSTFIDPLVNYWISHGMKRNDANGLASYVEDSTLQLLCSNLNSHSNSDTHGGNALPQRGCEKLLFASAFNAETGLPMNHATHCDLTSTSSAAVFYNIIVKDKPFSYKPTPPMKNSWVIVLVVTEIMMVFCIGLSCLILSLNLMRRLKIDSDQDALLQTLQEEDEAEDESEGLNRGLDTEGENIRLVGNQDGSDNTFPVLIWKFLQHVNPF